jgi:hypothetical protein
MTNPARIAATVVNLHRTIGQATCRRHHTVHAPTDTPVTPSRPLPSRSPSELTDPRSRDLHDG